MASRQTPDMRSRVAGNIALAIQDSGLSVAEIARRMGGRTSDRTLRRWRTGTTSPSNEALALFGSVVGITDPTWFYLPHEEAMPA